MLFVGVGDSERGGGELAGFSACIVLFNALDAAFDLAAVVEIGVEPGSIGRAESAAEAGDVLRNPIENAAVDSLAGGAVFGRSAFSEEIFECRARVDGHRQRSRWRRPTDRVG